MSPVTPKVELAHVRVAASVSTPLVVLNGIRPVVKAEVEYARMDVTLGIVRVTDPEDAGKLTVLRFAPEPTTTWLVTAWTARDVPRNRDRGLAAPVAPMSSVLSENNRVPVRVPPATGR